MNPCGALRFSGARLTDLREEAGLSRKALAALLSLRWEVIALWESSPAPDSPRAYPVHEPTALQIQDLARTFDAHPSDFFHSYENAPASEKDEERAAGKASGIRLDGEKLARLRKLRGLSCPQAAARARVPVAALQAAEAGRTINTCALLRLLQVYEPGEDPLEPMGRVVLRRGREAFRPEGAPRRRLARKSSTSRSASRGQCTTGLLRSRGVHKSRLRRREELEPPECVPTNKMVEHGAEALHPLGWSIDTRLTAAIEDQPPP